MQLEERPTLLLNQLMFLKKTNIPQLMEHTQLSKRQLTYDLDKINYWLKEKDLPTIVYKRTQWIEIPEKVQQYASNYNTDQTNERFIFSEEERLIAIYLFLFIRKEPISSIHLTSLLKVSKNTAVSDIKKANERISSYLVDIRYTRKAGYHLHGTEIDKRVLLMNLLTGLLEKPSGENIIAYILKKAGHTNRLADMLHILQTLEQTHQLHFVEERLNHFVYFLQFYYLRLKQHKWVTLHQDEIDVLKQEHMKEIAQKLLCDLQIEEQQSELGFLIIQLLGLSLGETACLNNHFDLLVNICEQLVSEFERKACITFRNKEYVIKTLYQHIKPAYFRMKYRIPICNPLLEQIKNEHKDLYTIVEEILLPVATFLKIVIPEEEIGFITIHFGALLNNPKQHGTKKKTAIIICPSGISSSLMVKHEIEALFSEIAVIKTLSLQQFMQQDVQNVDVIFSTVSLQTGHDYFLVKPIMTPIEKSNLVNAVYETLFGTVQQNTEHSRLLQIISEHANIFDPEGLQNALRAFTIHKQSSVIGGRKPMLHELITADKIQIADSVANWEESIALVAKPLVEQNIIEPTYIDAIIENVKNLGPYIVIGPEIAIPHARPEAGVNQVGMSLLKLQNPVQFSEDGSKPVTLLICIAAIDNSTHLKALSQLTRILSDKEAFATLKSMNNIEDIVALFAQYANVA